MCVLLFFLYYFTFSFFFVLLKTTHAKLDILFLFHSNGVTEIHLLV